MAERNPYDELAHTLDVYAGQPDAEFVIRATSDSRTGVVTGLTWGDLRGLKWTIDQAHRLLTGDVAHVCEPCRDRAGTSVGCSCGRVPESTSGR